MLSSALFSLWALAFFSYMPALAAAHGDGALARQDADALRSTIQAAQPSDELMTARAAMADQKWKKAIKILDKVLKQDPERLEARYLLAVCHRELAYIVFHNRARGLYFLSESDLRNTRREAWQHARGEQVNRRGTRGTKSVLDVTKAIHVLDVTKAIHAFEFILSRDSLYLDVLQQYAQLWRGHEVLTKAIELGEAQVRHKPDLAEAHAALVSTYGHYVSWTRPDPALRWLQEQATAYSAYFVGEVYRKDNKLNQAEEVFTRLLADKPLRIPPQPILLSLARIYISRDQIEEGYVFIEQALRLQNMTEARLVFEDFKYILTEEEYRAYPFLQTSGAYTAFFDRMWTSRNPTPATGINARLVEHYRRLVVAERDYADYSVRTGFNNPDEYKELSLPEASSLNRKFDDRGLIYIRHGEPDDWAGGIQSDIEAGLPEIGSERTIAGNFAESGTIRGNLAESWHYEHSQHDFHFVEIGSTTGLLRLVPVPPESVLEGVLLWDSDYMGFTKDPLLVRDLVVRKSREHVTSGLTTDRHTWPEEMERFDFAFTVAAFRGPRGMTDLSVYYALPIGRFSKASAADTLEVEVGMALHDTTWRSIVNRNTVLPVLPTDDVAVWSIGEMRFSVPPDSYHVALHSDLLESPLLGSYRFDRRVPDFSRAQTMMSDLVPAYEIVPKRDDLREPTKRDDLHIMPNPFHRFAPDQPVHVYFEIYQLGLDGEDLAHYSVEYALEPQKKRGLRRLFGGKEASLSVTSSFVSATPSPVVNMELDLHELSVGAYDLVIHVRDEQTGEEMTRRMPIVLYRE